MRLTLIDWLVVAAYFAFNLALGLSYRKKATQSVSDFFVGGRKVVWWLAGTSMVATTFAADTPLAVTGLVARNGISGNWIWWSMALSGIMTVFFYARLWRRAGVLTDVEFAEIRYSGAPARFLRGFRALFLALPINLIILGWVNLAMIKVLRITLGVDGTVAVIACFAVTVLYSAAGGMWAALWTDLIQLVIMMVAVIALAFFAVDAVGGLDALLVGGEPP